MRFLQFLVVWVQFPWSLLETWHIWVRSHPLQYGLIFYQNIIHLPLLAQYLLEPFPHFSIFLLAHLDRLAHPVPKLIQFNEPTVSLIRTVWSKIYFIPKKILEDLGFISLKDPGLCRCFLHDGRLLLLYP